MQTTGQDKVKAMASSIALLVAVVGAGCTALPRRDSVLPELTQAADTVEAPGARYWPELNIEPMLRDGVAAVVREKAQLASAGKASDTLPPEYELAISGGGDAGAFGAGLLVGWTESGTRPEFKIVTGISTGALIAPFAFLGPKYDGVLRQAGGSIGPADILHWRNWLSGLLGDGFADDSPLVAIIDKYITVDFLKEVADEYAKGRILLIGTTDLDAGRSVVWNMGAIASSSNPGALHLFRQVLLASASIPGVFPPVMIDVAVNGAHFQEMHVDGGVKAEVFLFPPLFFSGLKAQGEFEPRERHIFVIRNGRIEPQWESTTRRTQSVVRRALRTLIDEQGVGDLRRLYADAEENGEDFNLAYIDDAFKYPHRREFAPDYMQHLFAYAYQLSIEGYPWKRNLPTAKGSILNLASLKTCPLNEHASSARDVIEVNATPPRYRDSRRECN
jgi:hypothetical protein